MPQNSPPYPVQNAKFRAIEALRQAQLLTADRLETIGTAIEGLDHRPPPQDVEKATAGQAGELNNTLRAIVDRLDRSREDFGRLGTAIERLCDLIEQRTQDQEGDDSVAAAPSRNKSASKKEKPPEQPDSAA